MTVDLDFYGEIASIFMPATSTASGFCPTSPIAAKSISTTSLRPRWSSRIAGGEGHRGRVHLAQQDLFEWPAGASQLCGRQLQRLIAALTRVKSYLDYGAFTPIQVRGDRRAQRPAGLHRRDPPSATSGAGALTLVDGLRLAGWGHPGARSDDVRLGPPGARGIQKTLGSPAFLQAAVGARQCRGVAGHPALWRARRGLCPHRARRKPPAGCARRPLRNIKAFPRRPWQRHRRPSPRPEDAGGRNVGCLRRR